MPISQPSEASNVNVVTTAPTTILNVINSAFDDLDYPNALAADVIGAQTARVTVRGTANVTPGTACTSLTVKVFNAAGVQCGPLRTIGCTAGVNIEVPFFARDSSPQGTSSYSVQLTANAATGNSTVNDVIGECAMPG